MHPLQPHTPHDDEVPQAPWHSPWALEEEALPPGFSSARRQAVPSARPDRAPPEPPRKRTAQARDPIQQRVHQRRRRGQGALLVLAAVALVALFMARLYLRDEDRPQDSDLRPAAPVLTTSPPTAFVQWQTALNAAVLPKSAEALLKPAWEWDTPTLSRTAEANHATLRALESALLESDWQPQNPAWRTPEIGGHEGWDALALACSATIAYVSRRGDEQGALQSALDIAALGRQLQTISCWPTYYNHGLRLQQRASESLTELLRTSHADSRTLNQLQAAYEKLQPADSQLRDALNGFYQFERVLFTGVRKDDPWDTLPGGVPVHTQQQSRWFFKPYATLELFAKGFRGLKNEVMRPPYSWTDHLVHVVGPAGRPIESPGSPNYAGCRYANQRLWPYAQLMENHALQRTRHLLVMTLFAIRSYGADKGRAPGTLSDLIPRYFTSLPFDPFSGKPLGYDAPKGLVFSVGLDLKSDGGHLLPVPMSDPYEPTVSIR
jgi:hypothetical protein